MTLFEPGGSKPQYGERLEVGTDAHETWARTVAEYDPWAGERVARRRRRRGAVLAVAFFAVLLAGAVGLHLSGVLGAIAPRDSLEATYEPTLEVSALATTLQLTEEGQQIFFAAHPEILDAEPFLARCGDADAPADGSEDPIGCYTSPPERIAVFRPEDPRLDSQITTTAAHELLHAVWERLPDADHEALHGLLDAQYARIPADDPVQEQITGSIAGDRFNRDTELFAYLGTQNTGAGPLDPALEAYYARYFTARQAVADVDTTLQATLASGWAGYETHAGELSALAQANATERAQLDVDTEQLGLDRGLVGDRVAEYQARSPEDQARLYRADDEGGYAEPWGEYLDSLVAELDARETSIAEREAALTGAVAQEDQLEAALDTEYARLVALDEAALPR